MNEPHHNAPDLVGLTAEQQQIVDRGAQAVENLKRTFDQWMDVGHGLVVLRDRADQIKGRKTFLHLADQAGYGGMFRSASGEINYSVVSHLLDIMDHEAEVRQWRDQLTEHQRWAWVSPTSIKRWCPVFAKKEPQAKKPRHTSVAKFEGAIATLHDHLEKVDDADYRQTAIEQIVGPFFEETGLVLVSALRLQPIPERIAAVRELMMELDLSIEDFTQDDQPDQKKEVKKKKASRKVKCNVSSDS